MMKTLSLAGLFFVMAGSAFSQVAKLPDTGIDPKAPAAKPSTIVKEQQREQPGEQPGTLNRSVTNSRPTLTQGGAPGVMTSIMLDESFDVYSVAKIGPGGKLAFDCVTGKDAATKQVSLPAKKKEQLDEK